MKTPGESAFYFGNAGERMFAMLHPPTPGEGTAPKQAGWVFCTPFGEERGNCHRLMVEWARALSREGYWVLRFDYRGTGDSEGLLEEVTVADHVSDVGAAIAELERRSGVECCGLCGLRLGASVAALAAAREGRDLNLILWEPLVDGEAYADELLRAVITREMARTREAPVTRAQLRERLAAGGRVVVEGHVLTDAFVRSLSAVKLLTAGRPGQGPVFVMPILSRATARPKGPVESLCRLYGESGEVRLVPVLMPVPWTLGQEYDVCPSALFGPSLEWVRSNAPRADGPGVPADGPGVPADGPGVPADGPGVPADGPGVPADGLRRIRDRVEGASADGPALEGSSITIGGKSPGRGWTERAVSFPAGDSRLWGVIHLPENPAPDRPVVVILPIANNCRTSDARIYARMSRELASGGWISLRFDPRGAGDSDGDLAFSTIPELYLAIESGLFLPDVRAAVDFAERELGARSVVLTGICGGATTSVLYAADDSRVAGIVLLDLPLQHTAQPGLGKSVVNVRSSLRARFMARRTPFRLALRRRLLRYRRRYRGLTRGVRRLLPGAPVSAQAMEWFAERAKPRPNTRMIGDFLRCLGRRMPIFCIFGGTQNAFRFARVEPGFHRVCPYKAPQLVSYIIRDADHIFSAPEHAQRVFELFVEWLDAPGQPWSRAGEAAVQQVEPQATEGGMAITEK